MYDWNEPDHMLRNLVTSVDRNLDPGARAGITLTVGGLVVTGWLIPTRRWFELSHENIGAAGEPSMFSDAASDYRFYAEAQALEPPVIDQSAGQAVFIHLVDAVVISGAT